jgi:hypothetical protein
MRSTNLLRKKYNHPSWSGTRNRVNVITRRSPANWAKRNSPPLRFRSVLAQLTRKQGACAVLPFPNKKRSSEVGDEVDSSFTAPCRPTTLLYLFSRSDWDHALFL